MPWIRSAIGFFNNHIVFTLQPIPNNFQQQIAKNIEVYCLLLYETSACYRHITMYSAGSVHMYASCTIMLTHWKPRRKYTVPHYILGDWWPSGRRNSVLGVLLFANVDSNSHLSINDGEEENAIVTFLNEELGAFASVDHTKSLVFRLLKCAIYNA